jgi:hypothetical protein
MNSVDKLNGKLIYLVIFLISIVFVKIYSPGNKVVRFIGEFLIAYSVWRIFGGSHIRSVLIALITSIPLELDKEIFG